jgi:hypothetical protein
MRTTFQNQANEGRTANSGPAALQAAVEDLARAWLKIAPPPFNPGLIYPIMTLCFIPAHALVTNKGGPASGGSTFRRSYWACADTTARIAGSNSTGSGGTE